MKLFPPENDIAIYQEGFEGNDLLERTADSKRLSELVEKIEDPLVVAVDGDWGTGKSHFLKCWVGAHSLENDGDALTIYVDAFESDFLDDPLVALTCALQERFDNAGDPPSGWEKAKKAGALLFRPALRVGVAALTAGIVSRADDVVDAAVNKAAEQTNDRIDQFWAREADKQQAIRDFREALSEVTSASNSNGKAKRLVLVVDELDRCRPDYALAMLEVIKHFFAVPNVHFVLGVNLNELQNSVRARYGSKIDARKYLQKFVTLSFHLNSHLSDPNQTAVAHSYFNQMAEQMSIPEGRVDLAKRYRPWAGTEQNISIRDCQRVLSALAMMPDIERKVDGVGVLAIGLVLLRQFHPVVYQAAINGRATLKDICDCLGIAFLTDDTDFYEVDTYLAYVWGSALGHALPDAFSARDYGYPFGHHGIRNEDLVQRVNRDFVSKFTLETTRENTVA